MPIDPYATIMLAFSVIIGALSLSLIALERKPHGPSADRAQTRQSSGS